MFDEILLGAAIAAVTGELKKLFPVIAGWLTVVLAGALGGAYGFFTNGDVVRGVFVGVATSGAIKVGTTVRGS